MPLRLLSWNVRYGGHGLRGLAATSRWLRRIGAALCVRPPDVVALQEIEDRSLRAGLRRPQLDRLVDAVHAATDVRYRAIYVPAHRYEAIGVPLYTTGLAWLVREDLTVLDHEVVEITHLRLPWAAPVKQTRVASRLRVGTPEGPLDVVNTHLSLPALLEVGPHRVPQAMGDGSNQVREVDNLLAFVDQAGPALVLVGDFNSRPGSPAHAALAAVLDDAWAGRPARTAEFGPLRMHIDHVFGRGVRWVERVDHHVGDAGPYTGLSDHVPREVVVAVA